MAAKVLGEIHPSKASKSSFRQHIIGQIFVIIFNSDQPFTTPSVYFHHSPSTVQPIGSTIMQTKLSVIGILFCISVFCDLCTAFVPQRKNYHRSIGEGRFQSTHLNVIPADILADVEGKLFFAC